MNGNLTVLFDFDGVIADTESQYTIFWNRHGKDYLGAEDFGLTIKGQTLNQIMNGYFKDNPKVQNELKAMLDDFETSMSYDYVPGAYEFMMELKKKGIPTAIVTSSNLIKMAYAFKAHPELPSMVNIILTSEDFSRSKPDPECFIKGMEKLGAKPENTVIFEDSIHGINAGRAAGARIIGLTTTNKSEVLAPLCDMVIDDFTGFSLKKLI